MNHTFDHFKKTGYLHHANVIEGNYETVAPILVSFLVENLGISEKGNPDLMMQFYESFGIEEAREIKNTQTRASFSDTGKFFIIGAESFTHEAQNALLKTFEEPTLKTHFFLILPRTEILLPTLLSRVAVLTSDAHHEDEAKAFAEKFISSSLEDRFVLSKKLADKKDRDTTDRELFRRILDNIERILYSRNTGVHTNEQSNIFREIFLAKTYLADRGSSPKMILDHISIILPLT